MTLFSRIQVWWTGLSSIKKWNCKELQRKKNKNLLSDQIEMKQPLTQPKNYKVLFLFAVCQLARDPGPCQADFRHWYFNTESRQCEEFTYGGCQGNANRFNSKSECERTCHEFVEKKQVGKTQDMIFLVCLNLQSHDMQKKLSLSNLKPFLFRFPVW